MTLTSQRSIALLRPVSCQNDFPDTQFPAPVFLLGSGWSSWIRITLGCFNRESFVTCFTTEVLENSQFAGKKVREQRSGFYSHLKWGISGEGVSLGHKLLLWYHFLLLVCTSCCKVGGGAVFTPFSIQILFHKFSAYEIIPERSLSGSYLISF